MHSFLLDASALVKRYAPEVGTPLVNHLFASVTPDRLIMLNLGIAEVVSVLVRKKNDGRITPSAISQALLTFGAEVVDSPDFKKVEIDNRVVTSCLPLVKAHSLNATDAIILRSALDITAALRTAGHDLVLVASDQRLLRAATAEGMLTFNPEVDSTAGLDAFVASGPS